MVQQNINMRDYSIKKYKNNTHYIVNVIDSFGRENSGFFRKIQDCYNFVYKVWDKEKPLTDKEIQQNLLNKAISNCIKLDKKAGITSKNYDCLD